MEITSAQNGLEQTIFSVLHDNMGGDLSRARLRDVAEKIAVVVQPDENARKPVATVIKNGAERTWMSENMGKLPDGMYPLFIGPMPKKPELDVTAEGLLKMWREAEAKASHNMPAPLHYARMLLD